MAYSLLVLLFFTPALPAATSCSRDNLWTALSRLQLQELLKTRPKLCIQSPWFDNRAQWNARGYNWATLFLGEINTRTWPSRLRESQKWDNKLCLLVPWDSDLRKAALAMPGKNWLLVREGAHTSKPETVKKLSGREWEKISRWSQTGAWHQDWLADCRS
jgi:hypothetical protein